MAAIVTLLGSNVVSYYLGSHDIYKAWPVKDGYVDWDKKEWCSDNIRELSAKKTEYIGALMDLLHLWYSNDDNDFWFDVVIKTPEYKRVESINHGNWEDFYYYETPKLVYEDWVNVER